MSDDAQGPSSDRRLLASVWKEAGRKACRRFGTLFRVEGWENSAVETDVYLVLQRLRLPFDRPPNNPGFITIVQDKVRDRLRGHCRRRRRWFEELRSIPRQKVVKDRHDPALAEIDDQEEAMSFFGEILERARRHQPQLYRSLAAVVASACRNLGWMDRELERDPEYLEIARHVRALSNDRDAVLAAVGYGSTRRARQHIAAAWHQFLRRAV